MATRLWSGTRILGNVRTEGHELTVHHCGGCGLVFAIDNDYDDTLRENHAGFYCPKCQTSYSYGHESKLARAERLRREAEQRAEARLQLLRQEERSHIATRGHLTRLRNERARMVARVANGVCPCCNRTFKQLARHMTAKHPDYLDEQAKADE